MNCKFKPKTEKKILFVVKSRFTFSISNCDNNSSTTTKKEENQNKLCDNNLNI